MAGDEFEEFYFMNKFQCGYAVAKQRVAAATRDASLRAQKKKLHSHSHRNVCANEVIIEMHGIMQYDHCDPVRNSTHLKSNFDPLTAFRVTGKLVQPTTLTTHKRASYCL